MMSLAAGTYKNVRNFWIITGLFFAILYYFWLK